MRKPAANTRRRGTSAQHGAAREVIGLRLPRLAAPLPLSLRHSPFAGGVDYSATCDACLAGCQRLPGRLQTICRELCSFVCSR